MSEKSEALLCAEVLEAARDDPMWADHSEITKEACHRSAAELRRLSAENRCFAALVCEYASEEAPDAIRKIAVDRDRWHTKAQQAEAQRDALLEVLKKVAAIEDKMFGSDWEEIEEAREIARAAIKAVEEGK